MRTSKGLYKILFYNILYMNSNFNDLINIFFDIYYNIKLIQLQNNVEVSPKDISENKFIELYKNLNIFYNKL